MLETVTTFLTAIKQTTPVILLGVVIAASVGVFGSDGLMASLGLAELRTQYRPYLGGTLVLASSVLIAQGLAAIGRLVPSYLEKRRKKRRAAEALAQMQDALHSLTPDEKAYLLPFAIEEQNTLYFQIEDGVAGGLVAKHILFRSSNIGHMRSGFAHNIQPWAREYLVGNRHLLEGANPSPSGPPRR